MLGMAWDLMPQTWRSRTPTSILALGARFDDRVTARSTSRPRGQIIQATSTRLDLQERPGASADRRDVKSVLHDLLPHRAGEDRLAGKAPALALPGSRLGRRSSRSPTSWDRQDDQTAVRRGERSGSWTRGEAIICTEVGQNQMWTPSFTSSRTPRSFVTPAARHDGFRFAGRHRRAGRPFPTASSSDIAGTQHPDEHPGADDGGTVPAAGQGGSSEQWFSRHGPQWKELFYDKRYSLDLPEAARPDFVKLAEASGATGLRQPSLRKVVPTLSGVRDPGTGHGGQCGFPRGKCLPHVPRGLPQKR